MSCEILGNLTICYGPKTKVIAEERDDNRWCFGCRKRGGTWKCHASVEPSYYEPGWSFECDKCHRDKTSFPV